MSRKQDIVDEALKPAERKVYHDWHDDGMLILDLLLSRLPERQAAIKALYEQCPHKHSICTSTGKQTPVTAHTVAAWAGKHPTVPGRLRAKGLLPRVGAQP